MSLSHMASTHTQPALCRRQAKTTTNSWSRKYERESSSSSVVVSQMSVWRASVCVTSTRRPASLREFATEKFGLLLLLLSRAEDGLASCVTHVRLTPTPTPKMASLWNFVVNSFRGLCLALTLARDSRKRRRRFDIRWPLIKPK